MDTLDKILNSIGSATTSYIDAWGRVKVASLDAQVQPPAPLSQASYMGMNATMLIVLGIAAVGVVLVLKK